MYADYKQFSQLFRLRGRAVCCHVKAGMMRSHVEAAAVKALSLARQLPGNVTSSAGDDDGDTQISSLNLRTSSGQIQSNEVFP